MWEAAKPWLFANNSLEELAIDSLILEGAKGIASGRCRSIAAIPQEYSDSKHRILCANRASKRKSFGIREEHRVV